MSYISWREENEEKVKKIVEDGALETLPAWKYIAHNELTDTMITPIVDNILKGDWDPITVACVFAEYLYERYHIEPVDAEILVQMIIKSYMSKTEERIKAAVDVAIKLALESLSDEEDGEDDN